MKHGLGTLNVVGVTPQCHAGGIGSALFAAAENFWLECGRNHYRDGIDEILLAKFYCRPGNI